MNDDTREIVLTKGFSATVDTADFEWLSQWKWYAANVGSADKPVFYARRPSPRQRGEKRAPAISMHREIMQAKNGYEVDHISGDTLDNRRINLRVCLHKQNCHNKRTPRSRWGYFGVAQKKGSVRFHSRILIDRKIMHLGIYDTVEEAAIAFDSAAKYLRGQYAGLNFPDRETQARSPEEIRKATESNEKYGRWPKKDDR